MPSFPASKLGLSASDIQDIFKCMLLSLFYPDELKLLILPVLESFSAVLSIIELSPKY